MSLNETFQVKEFAFRWSGTTRVWKNGSLSVFENDDKEIFKFANGSYGESIQGIWLEFELSSPFIRRLLPAADAGNDFNDLRSALNDATVTVEFFPIYDVDPLIKYEVIKTAGRSELLNTTRGIFAPAVSLQLRAVDRINDGVVPSWLNFTKTG